MEIRYIIILAALAAAFALVYLLGYLVGYEGCRKDYKIRAERVDKWYNTHEFVNGNWRPIRKSNM